MSLYIPSRTVLLSLLLSPLSQAASVSTPSVRMELVRSDLDPDPSFTRGAAGSSWSRAETTAPDGSLRTKAEGRHEGAGTRSSDAGIGGGTLTWESSKSFDATLHQREISGPSAWSFDSTFDFSTTLDYTATSTTHGKFFFALVAENTNAVSFDRYARVVVDRPLVLHLSLTGAFSHGYFSDATGSMIFMSEPFNLAGMMFASSFRSLTGSEETASITRSGTSGKTDFNATASGNRDGVSFEIFLTPKDPGSPEELELRWFVDYQSKLHAMGSNRLSASLDRSGSIRESFTVTIVPEPSGALLAAVGGAFACGVRRRLRCPR